MPEPATPSAPPTPNPIKQRRRTPAEHRYPLFDLNSSLAVAKVVKERGGNACSAAQLASFLNYDSAIGGGFVRRVTAARLFGLIEHTGGQYRITARAETILYPVTPQARQRALVEAWQAIPLYRRIFDQHRGVRLPEEFGMRNLLTTNYSVPGQHEASRVYRVMMDSADFAGLFAQGRRTHLVEPVFGSPDFAPAAQPDEEEEPRATPNGGGPPASTGDGGGTGAGPGLHAALRGLLSLLPTQPGPWAGREAFDAAWTHTLDVLYPRAAKQGNGGPE